MNSHLCRLSLTALVSMVLTSLGGAVSAADPTLPIVKTRGQLVCGINGQLPDFAIHDAQGSKGGLEVEFCRAIAAAALGDAGKVRFVQSS